MLLNISANQVIGLDDVAQYKFNKLLNTYNLHNAKNAEKYIILMENIYFLA